ncbi:hypothetical protein [Desulfosudis oleivorans]|uniref:Uncharacterized protein n=1 Tax=Desulfosudis oleivorans (strain DSM 6200 / JCM 39069 / Hxd3) TaxID=96561 RepID=A8ZX80_DESOH|nr:hypothetical protein [Desulfosudis oleivorans]ABW68459.1 hypothetical protein Dole_2656 [Desulfosudis oleivorans Hxd3]
MSNSFFSPRTACLFVLCFFYGIYAWAAQEAPDVPETVRAGAHYKTVLPDNARYEVLQSATAPKWLFRLDRYTGQVFQLVQSLTGEVAWIEMLVWERPEIKKPATARFQLFVSGFSAAYNVLVDTVEGRSWIFQVRAVKNKDTGESVDMTGWFPILPPEAVQAERGTK